MPTSDGFESVQLDGADAQVSERDGAVVALKHDRPCRFFVELEGSGARGTRDLDVLVKKHAVVDHFHEAAVRDLLARGVEPRRAKDDVERLPFARRTAGVDRWR